MTKALGMDAGDLETALAGGQTLADVAKSRGVAKDDLVAATAKDMQANAPAGAPALDDAKAAEMATNLVEGKHPPPGGHHGPPPGAPAPSDATGTPRAQANLSDLASRLGLDPQGAARAVAAAPGCRGRLRRPAEPPETARSCTTNVQSNSWTPPP